MKTFEIKIGRNWTKVQSKGMVSINKYCEQKNIKDWRMVGMQSRAEILQNKNLPICNAD